MGYPPLPRDRAGLELQLDAEEDAVELLVRDSKLPFIRLPGPQARGGRPVDDRIWYPEVPRHRADLGFVQIADGKEVHAPVAVAGEVSAEDLALVPRPHDEAVLGVRDIVQDNHPAPRAEVPPGHARRFRGLEALLERCDEG